MSELGPIIDTLETIIVASTTLTDITRGTPTHPGERPYGSIAFGKGGISSQGMDGTVDCHLQTAVFVWGDDWEEVQVAIEELNVLFMDDTHYNALKTAHDEVIDFKVIEYIPAGMAEGLKLSKYVGQVLFDLHIRYNY